MSVERMAPGVCHNAGFIYTTGGLQDLSEVDKGQENPSPITSCERYDIKHNRWEELMPLKMPGAAKSAPTLITDGNWLYQIAGNFGNNLIYRLNLYKPKSAWEQIPCATPETATILSCGQMGVLNLNAAERKTKHAKFLAFGGINNDGIEQSKTVRISIKDGYFFCEEAGDLACTDRFFQSH